MRTSTKKKLKKWLIILLIVSLIYIVATGFLKINNAIVWGFTPAEDGSSITIQTGVSVPIGYPRDCKISHSGNILYVDFYACFGGLNSRIMAQNEYEIDLPTGVTEIRFCRFGGSYETVLQKDEAGNWFAPEKPEE